MSGVQQISLFDGIPQAGQWVETHGRELSFDEIAERTGQLIVMDMSTESHDWYKIVRVQRIIYRDETRRLIYDDNSRHAGYVDERYFDPDRKTGRARAYEVE